MRAATVILANGEFPREGSEARRILEAAERVVACDGAADAYFAAFTRYPDVTVGDLDSISRAARENAPRVVHIPEQETNDLAKAARVCQENGWRAPVVLGATGRREDHTIANLFLALELRLEVVTSEGRFIPLEGAREFLIEHGAAVSIFAPDPATKMTSQGLEWPLDGVKFANLYCAALNRATSSKVVLTADRPVLVYFPFTDSKKN